MSFTRLDISQADFIKGQVAAQLKKLVDDACKAAKEPKIEVHYTMTARPDQSQEDAEAIDDEVHAAASRDKRIVGIIPHMDASSGLNDEIGDVSLAALMSVLGQFKIAENQPKLPAPKANPAALNKP